MYKHQMCIEMPHLKPEFALCMTDGCKQRKTVTAAGNPRDFPLEDVVAWVIQAWEAVTPETVKNSFKSCGIVDGSDGDMIVCMQEGRYYAVRR